MFAVLLRRKPDPRYLRHGLPAHLIRLEGVAPTSCTGSQKQTAPDHRITSMLAMRGPCAQDTRGGRLAVAIVADNFGGASA